MFCPECNYEYDSWWDNDEGMLTCPMCLQECLQDELLKEKENKIEDADMDGFAEFSIKINNLITDYSKEHGLIGIISSSEGNGLALYKTPDHWEDREIIYVNEDEILIVSSCESDILNKFNCLSSDLTAQNIYEYLSRSYAMIDLKEQEI